jgi:hypothetical protein
VTVLLAIALLAASAASAATPTQIYRDYQDNGRLDGRYSVADLQAALKNPAVQGYGGPTITPGEKQQIIQKLGAQQGTGGTGNSTGGGLPFTGFDLGLLTVGGALLLTVGFGLRRVARAKSTSN